MVTDASCAEGGVLTGGVAGSCCTGALGSGALGCSDVPSVVVTLAGGAASRVSVDFP